MQIAAAFIRSGDEVVLVLQGAPGEEPAWGVPGGRVDEGELVPEALVREVLEETGLEISAPARLAYVHQIDERGPVRLVGGREPGSGYLATVWAFDVEHWQGVLDPRDPDGFVKEARFVPVGEAAVLLRRTSWLELAADYLDGRVEPGSLRFERRHEDGRIETPLA